MTPIRRARPRIEALEARDCPAVTLKSLPTALFITGTPTGALTIKGLASGAFNVSDNGKSLGNYTLNRSLIVQLSSRPSDLEIDLNGKTLGGNVILNLGNGYVGAPSASVSVDVFDSTNSGANVRGSVTIVRGNGRELIGLGGNTDGGGTFQTGAVTIRGNVTVAARMSGTGQDQLQAGAGSKFLGSMTLVQVDAVSLGEQNVNGVTVSKNVSVTTTGGTPSNTVTILGNFGGSVSVNGLATSLGINAFTLQPQNTATGTTVAGNVSVTFGQAVNGNIFQIFGDAGNPVTSSVGGNVTFTSRNAVAGMFSDLYRIQGVIAGSLFANLGFGDTDFSFMNAGGGVNADVAGNVVIQGQGGGTTNIGIGGANLFEGDVGGNVTISLGNGTNSTRISSAVPGRFTYRGGNGSDTVELAPLALQTYLVDMTFGSGTNVLTLNDQVILSGIIRGNALANNTLMQNMATLTPNLILINFP